MDPIWNYAVLHPNSILPPVKEHTAEEKESLQYVDRFEERFKFARIENLIYDIDEITKAMEKELYSDIDIGVKIFNIQKHANKLKFSKDSENIDKILNVKSINHIKLIKKYIKELKMIVKKRKELRTSLSKLLYGSSAPMDGKKSRKSSIRKRSRKSSIRKRS